MNIRWDAENYKGQFDFVPSYGEAVTQLLTVGPGAAVADVGCGNGTLTKALSDKGYRVIGIDGSPDMLRRARADYPSLAFVQADATQFQLEEPADALFSNAVFHWIDADLQDRLIQNLADNLRPGGELVFEFGGKGCAERVHSCLEQIFTARGYSYRRTFYFPSIGEYAPMLERHGFQVRYAVLFDRPTPQKGKDGLADWIRMFDTKPFEGIPQPEKEEMIMTAQEQLREELYHDGQWYVDYVRIRMRAVKKA